MQGYVFTGICHSVYQAEGVSQHALGHTPPGRHAPGQTPPPTATAGDGTHPTGMHTYLIRKSLSIDIGGAISICYSLLRVVFGLGVGQCE